MVEVKNEVLNNNTENYKKQKCQIRELDPYHADVLPYLSKHTLPPCTIKRYGTLHDGILHLKVTDLQEAWLYYIRRKGDFDFEWSQAYRVDNITNKGKSKHLFIYLFVCLCFCFCLFI